MDIDKIFDIHGASSECSQISIITDFATLRNGLGKDGELPLEGRELPILPLRRTTLFPETLMPVSVNRQSATRLLEEAAEKETLFAVFSQKNEAANNPHREDLYEVGVLARVAKLLRLPDGGLTAFVQGGCRVKLIEAHEGRDYLVGTVEAISEHLPKEGSRSFMATVEACKELAEKLSQHVEGARIANHVELKDVNACVFFVNFICVGLPIETAEMQSLLELDDLQERATALLGILSRECEYAELKEHIQTQTRQDLNQQQREFFLKREMENIKEELGEGQNSDVAALRALLSEKREAMGAKLTERIEKEISKLERISAQSPEYSTQYEWLEAVFRMPWGEVSKEGWDLPHAEKVLNHDHFGMEKVKERILEHLAVARLRADAESASTGSSHAAKGSKTDSTKASPILCLYGPPGVGKTSLGRSIAKAMGRQYVRVSLGGINDEAELRGHRRTYVGAMAGRIVKGLMEAKTDNPVFVLDEVDKVSGNNINGDPASALLEVLDPEQNYSFHDNYLDLPYDLSGIMFIATANTTSTIPAPLLDRMELIEVSGYLREEKVEIARRHLLPKQLKGMGLKRGDVRLSKRAIERIIDDYTREAGVRELEKKIGKLIRRLALTSMREGKQPEWPVKVDANDVPALLGLAEFVRSEQDTLSYPGVATGLAWTAVGGETLCVETSVSEGKGGKLTLTGNLGDVMKESAMLAMEYVRAHATSLGLTSDIFETHNLHVHVPEGAVPKDGPSAGITIATSIASALTGRCVRPHLAMTGELTLRGRVLPVGGIKEKILAAKRVGITDIVLCYENERHIADIPEQYVKGVTFHYVKDVGEVFSYAGLVQH